MSCSAGVSGTGSGPSRVVCDANSSSEGLKILLDVGPEMERSAGPQRSLDVAEERFPHHPPPPVPLLPPRVGKIDVHGRQRIVGNQFLKDPQAVTVDHDGIRQAGFDQTCTREFGVFFGHFDAEEVNFRLGRGGIPQECVCCAMWARAGRAQAAKPSQAKEIVGEL